MVPPSAPNMRSAPLHFGMELSPVQHELLVGKVIAIFESDALQKRASKITVENLWTYRFVIQHWVSTADLCASKDLDACQVWFYLPALVLCFLGLIFQPLKLPNVLIASSCHHSFLTNPRMSLDIAWSRKQC